MAEVSIGVNVLVSRGGTVIAGQKNATLTVTVDPIEIQDKSDAETVSRMVWKVLSETGGDASWQLQCDGLIKANGASSILADLIAGTLVDLVMTDTDEGTTITGVGKTTSWEKNGGEKEVSFSATYDGSGPLVAA